MTWEFGGGGVVLSMVANNGMYGVEEVNAANDLPKARGDNPIVPLRDGRLHTEKLFDQRIITLGMWVVGNSAADFDSRVDTLKQLFGSRSRQLLKCTMGDGSVRQAYAEVVNQLGFRRTGPFSGRFTVDFLLADPFMRSDTLTSSGQQDVVSSPYDFSLNNPGTVRDKSAIITFRGPLQNPRVENMNNNIWVGLRGTLGTSDEVSVDVGSFTVNPAAWLASMEHSGDAYFMVLEAGDNSIRVTTDTTGGWVKIVFYAPYL